MRFEDLVNLPKNELPKRLRSGYPIDPHALDHTLYRGVSLGLPRWAERLTWKTFAKTFYRGKDGQLYGWNVRLQQTGIHGAIVPKQRNGAPRCFGFYGVTRARGYTAPNDCDGGLSIQYRLGPNPRLHPIRWVRDPLVAIRPNDPTLLLGWSYVHLLGGIWTPSYFALKKEGALDYIPKIMQGWSAPQRLLLPEDRDENSAF